MAEDRPPFLLPFRFDSTYEIRNLLRHETNVTPILLPRETEVILENYKWNKGIIWWGVLKDFFRTDLETHMADDTDRFHLGIFRLEDHIRNASIYPMYVDYSDIREYIVHRRPANTYTKEEMLKMYVLTAESINNILTRNNFLIRWNVEDHQSDDGYTSDERNEN
jgi:hypothetical protein